MSDCLPKNVRKTLVQEISRWQQEQLISSDVAAKLLLLYPERNNGGNIAGILMTIGSVLIGLGALLFIASNWSIMPAFAKIALILASISTAYTSGWYFKFEPGARPKLGSALLLLGALLFGAGVWLISQIYNMDISLADGMFIWALGVFPLALITRTLSIGVLSVALTGVWSLCHSDVQATNSVPHFWYASQFAVGFASSLFLTYSLRSRWCLSLTLLSAFCWTVVHGGALLGLLSIGVAFLATFLWHDRNRPYFAPIYLMAGLIITLGSLTALTFSQSDLGSVQRADGWGMWVVSWCVLLVTACKRKEFAAEIVFLGLVLSGMLAMLGTFNLVQALISNMVLLVMLLGLMFYSANRHKNVLILNTAVIFLVLDIICRYFDIFFKTIDRSLFFVAGGFVFLIVATILEHNRRKLLEGFTK